MSTFRLVLWDIDHTMIATGGVGSQVALDAFAAVTGVRLDRMPDPTGKTESAIFAAALASAGLEASDDGFEQFSQAQAAGYRARAAELRERGRVLPGAAKILAELAGAGGVVQSVLSGNTRIAGEAKLGVFGLADFVDLEVGAGGDDDAVRANLVPVAWDRVERKYGRRFGPTDTVLIGDTPSDVETGHAHGCRVVAVATGSTSVDELTRCGADAILADLSDTDKALDTILLRTQEVAPESRR